MSLVLTRQVGEEVVCSDGRGRFMVVRVAQIRGDKVRLAFEAPTAIAVHRAEIWDAIQAERGAAGLVRKAGDAA